jgi:hydrogenase-4 component H
MGIISLLRQNFSHRSRTRRPDDRVPSPQGFRGALLHSTELCVGCRTCAYVCSPSAITFSDQGTDGVLWSYQADRCTFCGRCAEFCPCDALEFASEAPPVVTERSQLLTQHLVVYQACTGCGAPIVPLPLPVMLRMYGDPLPAELAGIRSLCEKCRARRYGSRVKAAFEGFRRNPA